MMDFKPVNVVVCYYYLKLLIKDYVDKLKDLCKKTDNNDK